MRTGVRIERPQKRGTPPPSEDSPRPFGPRGSVLLEIAPRQHISGRPCHTPAAVLCRPRAGRRFGAPFVDSPRRHRDRVDRRTDPAGIARGEASHTRARTCSPQWSNHRRNARNSTAHSTADSSALRRGPRLLFRALRRAGPRPHPHRSGTVRRTPPTQRTSPLGCLPRHGVRAEHTPGLGERRADRWDPGSPGCSTWDSDGLGTIPRTRRPEVIHIPRRTRRAFVATVLPHHSRSGVGPSERGRGERKS